MDRFDQFLYLALVVGHREIDVRIDNVDHMMSDPLLRLFIRFGCTYIHAPINSHGIAGYYLCSQLLRHLQGYFSFAYCGRAHQGCQSKHGLTPSSATPSSNIDHPIDDGIVPAAWNPAKSQSFKLITGGLGFHNHPAAGCPAGLFNRGRVEGLGVGQFAQRV